MLCVLFEEYNENQMFTLHFKYFLFFFFSFDLIQFAFYSSNFDLYSCRRRSVRIHWVSHRQIHRNQGEVMYKFHLFLTIDYLLRFDRSGSLSDRRQIIWNNNLYNNKKNRILFVLFVINYV